MEAFPIQFCRGIRSYWRSRKYQRIKGVSNGNKTGKVIRFGGNRTGSTSTSTSTKRRFRLRSAFKLRIRVLNPIRILARIRDAYVDSMMGVADRGSSLSDSVGTQSMVGRRIPKARSVRAKPEDFEQRLILEIYKSVMQSRELAASLHKQD